MLTTLLYGSESWTWYRRHVKKLDQFHLKCPRKICGITWKDRIPNITVLECCEIEGIEALLIKGQLRWAGHLTRMEENRIPKALFYGELVDGKRSRGGQHKRYKDVLKYNLKACDIPIETWERQALNRPEIGRAHVWTPVTPISRMPSSAWKKKKKKKKKEYKLLILKLRTEKR